MDVLAVEINVLCIGGGLFGAPAAATTTATPGATAAAGTASVAQAKAVAVEHRKVHFHSIKIKNNTI